MFGPLDVVAGSDVVNLLNVLDLPVPIAVQHNVFGTRWRIQLGDGSAELCLPIAMYDTANNLFTFAPPRVRGSTSLMRWLTGWSSDTQSPSWAHGTSWTVSNPSSLGSAAGLVDGGCD